MHPFEKAVLFLLENAAAGHMGLGVPRVEARQILSEVRAPTAEFLIEPQAVQENFVPQPGDKLVIDPEDFPPEVTNEEIPQEAQP